MENYLEGYHIPNMHPSLNTIVDMDNYNVIVNGNICEHIVPPAIGYEDNSASAGLWVYLSPTLAINYYKDGMNLERIVPVGHDTTEIRYTYLFNRNASQQSIDDSIATSAVVSNCSTIYLNNI